jgi:hypothetical protein
MSHDRTSPFEIAGGSVTGRAHLLSGKGNQDAYHWTFRGDNLAAVVCDGCGSGSRSEVGAALGARLVTEQIARETERGAALDAPELWERVRSGALAELERLADAIGGRRAEAVSELLLFTVVGVVITREQAAIVSIGDGLFAVGDEVRTLGPFPRNEPPYLSYGLCDPTPDQRRSPRFTVHRVLPADQIEAVLIGTDGASALCELAGHKLPGGEGGEVGSLDRLWKDDRYFQNQDAIRRRLAQLNREVTRPLWSERLVVREAGLLEDDTTLVVVRRRRAEGGAPCSR